MNVSPSLLLRTAAACAVLVTTPVFAAAPEAPALSAAELAAQLSARQEGTSLVRLRMDIAGPAKTALQLQIKSRASRGGAELVYQVLWPKERKGEGVLLRRGGGAVFTPPDTVRTITAAQMREPLFGSDLSYEDVVENFFSWDQQAIVGNEAVDRVNCAILESKPGKGGRSSYTSVRTWVDTRRLVPLRVEKYTGAGKLARRIDTTAVHLDDKGRPIPANLTVRGPGDSVTELDGSRIKHGVSFSDEEFTPEGLKQPISGRSTAE